jgi:tetratricopeptide (TPR) repeat protein
MQNATMPIGAKTSYGSTKSGIKLARQLFQKAISVNPPSPEAYLRLGRAPGLLDHHQEALAELQKAAASIKDPQVSYYSEAREQYEHAAALYATAQSPFALSKPAGSRQQW